MANVSGYERLQIASVMDDRPRQVHRGHALFLMSERDELRVVFQAAVLPPTI